MGSILLQIRPFGNKIQKCPNKTLKKFSGTSKITKLGIPILLDHTCFLVFVLIAIGLFQL